MRTRPKLTVSQILQWADAHHRRTGTWPTSRLRAVVGAKDESWMAISQALAVGMRGLPGGDSLPRLLERKRGVLNRANRRPLSIKMILNWADAHHRQTGRWPKENTQPGPADGENWSAIHWALYFGHRGLRGGSSLSRLLAKQRGVRNWRDRPPLSERAIVKWADAHHRRTGRWPSQDSGVIPGGDGYTWYAVHWALKEGRHGLPAQGSLAKLLFEQRGVRRSSVLPPLSISQILSWADSHHARTGQWPTQRSGQVHESPGTFWHSLQGALLNGRRGLPGGSSVAELLRQHRSRENKANLPRLSIPQIVKWARRHRARTGAWPQKRDGAIHEAPHLTWKRIESVLRVGSRGLPSNKTLAQILEERCGARTYRTFPRVTIHQILAWADDHHRRTGKWPSTRSGRVRADRHESWVAIDKALRDGVRGLHGGTTLFRLLMERRAVTRGSDRKRIEHLERLYLRPPTRQAPRPRPRPKPRR